MGIRRAHLVVAAAVLGVAALAGAALRPNPIEVDTAVVSRGPLVVTVDAEGQTRVRDRYVITAPVAGRLERIDLPDGAHLRAGDLVARIAPLPLDAQAVRQAKARLAGARAQSRDAATHVAQAQAVLDQERRTARRVAVLNESGALALRDREEADLRVQLRENELAGARAQARAAEAEVAQARAALVSVGGGSAQVMLDIRAPVSGCVLRIPERSERVVAAGTPIIEFGDPGALELVVDVLSTDAARIHEGQRVILDHWGGRTPLRGRVRTLERAAFTRVSALGVEEQRVNVLIDVPDPPPELSDGYRVEAHIVVWDEPTVVSVPASALFRVGEQWAVFTIRGGRAVERPVTIGEQAGAAAEVRAGVAAGDTVIVFPSDRVEHGGRVRANR